ncbi:MAG: transposase zinc-binding domain-containing protein [Coprococcus phoceensis]
MIPISNYKIQQIWLHSFGEHLSDVQWKASRAIMNCKSGSLGSSISQCTDCGHTEFHHNSCRNRNCPNCQAVLKEVWIDKRRAEVIDSPYFHVVFTLPHELNALLYCNQKLLYGLLHRCCAETLLELSSDKKYLEQHRDHSSPAYMESRIGLSRTYALHRFGWWSDQQPKNPDIPKQVFYPDTCVAR